MMLFNSKARRHQIAVALLLIVTALLGPSCLPGGGVIPPPSYHRPAITSDGAGGIMVFFATPEEHLGQEGFWCGRRRFYVQRVDEEGNFLWGGEEGVLVWKGHSLNSLALDIVRDGSGGGILIWQAAPEMENRVYVPRISVARVSPQGEILWK